MKRILFLFLPFLPYLASAQVAKDTVTVLTIADIPAGAIRDTTNITFVQDNAFAKATFDSLAKYTRVKLIGDRGDITVSGSTGLTWELDAGVVDSMQLSAGAVVLPGAKVTGTLPVGKGGTGLSTMTAANRIPYATSATAMTTSSNFTYDGTRLVLNYGDRNVAIGDSAGNSNSGIVNTMIGAKAGKNLRSTASSNLFIGALSGSSDSVTGDYNMGLGYSTLEKLTTGNSNVEIGSAQAFLTTGSNNIFIGFLAGRTSNQANGITTSSDNIYIGAYSFASSTTATNEIVIGGKNVVGIGDNSVLIGNNFTTKTELKGNVGLGVSAPAYKLDVNGNVRADTYYYDVGSALVSSSDANFKKNILPLPPMLQKINALQPVEFEWNDLKLDQMQGRDNLHKMLGKNIGLIAQDVYNVFPEFTGEDAEGNMTVSYISLIVPMLKAIQEQQQQIEALKARITQLENK